MEIFFILYFIGAMITVGVVTDALRVTYTRIEDRWAVPLVVTFWPLSWIAVVSCCLYEKITGKALCTKE